MLKDRLLIVLFFFAIVFLSSCKDSELAKEMEGTWTTSYVMSYEDGTKSYIDEQVTFKKDDSNKDGGSFIEIRTGQEEEDGDDYNVKYSWISKIAGTWEVNIESLEMIYNISSLEVEVGKDDVDYNLKNDAFLWNDWGTLITSGLYINNNLYKELKKETYRRLFRYYKKTNNDIKNNGVSFSDVQIHGSVLSFETADMGRIKYYRVKEGNKLKRKKKEEITDDDNKDKQAELLQDDENSDAITTEEIDYSHQLSGFIDKYEIIMYFNLLEDGNVSGYYYYDSQGPEKKIYFSGQLHKEDLKTHLTLNCDNQDIFDGYIEDNKYSGYFTNSSKQLVFNLRMLN